MQVVDPSRMEVHVLVNQQDLTNLHPGQPVRIHLDAYSDIHLRGQLDSIDPMGETGDFSEKIRTFQAVFSIQGSESRLMPDLSAAVDVDRNSSGGGQSR
jgi:multidrug resistance efflux pump